MVRVEAGDALRLGDPQTLFSVVSPTAPLISGTFNNEGRLFTPHAMAAASRCFISRSRNHSTRSP
jgi:hypothetical protein